MKAFVGTLRVLAGLLVCCLVYACGDDGHESGGRTQPVCVEDTMPQWLTVRPGDRVELAEGLTTLAMRSTHAVYRRRDGALGSTAPYLELDGQWLELVDDVILGDTAGSKALRVQLVGCETEARTIEDYVITAVTSCRVAVTRPCATSVPRVVPAPVRHVARFETRYVATDGAVMDTRLPAFPTGRTAIRSTGFDVGLVDDTEPRQVRTAGFGIDVVTQFGVWNVEIDSSIDPIVGHVEHGAVGPYQGTLRVLDVASSSTRCDDGFCRDVLIVEVNLEPVTDASVRPRVLRYLSVHF